MLNKKLQQAALTRSKPYCILLAMYEYSDSVFSVGIDKPLTNCLKINYIFSLTYQAVSLKLDLPYQF